MRSGKENVQKKVASEGSTALADDWARSQFGSADLAGETESWLEGPAGGDCEP